jgi:hypothetical protein
VVRLIMAHYKIEKSGCCEHKGLCQVRADFYWDEKDAGYKLTECKIYPEKGYEGKVNEMGTPADLEAYKKWEDSLPTELKHLPFHSHFIYFHDTVRDDEILFCFELALDWRVKNQPVKNVKPVWDLSKSVISKARIDSVIAKDFTTVSEVYSVK